MHLADHIRPLLRDHDCVIIPDFGGLVANASAARAQPGRQVLSPPGKLVAFNQSLTRNDGLLVDALSQHLGLPIAQAREAVRSAVAALQSELDATNRTELPGIGIFRRATGRGLAFEYTGTDNLLSSAFGLPEMAARPVRTADARPRRPQPALRGAGIRRSRWAKLLPGGLVAAAAALLLLVGYQATQKGGYLPANWSSALVKTEQLQRPLAPALPAAEPQQATLGQHDFSRSEAPAESFTAAADSATVSFDDASAEWPAADAPVTAAVAPAVVLPADEKAHVVVKPAPAFPAKAVAPSAPVKALVKAPVRADSKVATATATIKTRTGRYYVIAGAYSTLAHAEQGRKVLTRTGHAARIILPHFGSRLYRLTAGDYPDLAAAQREARRLRVSTHCDYNTLKF